ncbi:NAD(P)-dependent malic enzyme [Tichowtungia aerotolerans]|uniref:NAD-dependent malic enzyme n=1 Tax=Tichowtungia aerotolerans TaxID=2697043 RepID=A0A6P1M7Y3_9BACT|nr:NADP-dependent malic enzyme [Tichowtungia aerotolerans]QHI70700.1 NAD-dependent malic enzyme [Tichowtungia aerotolerans]
MKINPSPSFSIDLRVESSLSRQDLENIIATAEGVCVASQGIESPYGFTVNCRDSEHQQQIFQTLENTENTTVISADEITFRSHIGGKIETFNRLDLHAPGAMSIAYTPGVARVCSAIHEDVTRADALTIKKNMVAVVSDGTAVLGLGDIGPEAAMPVMEGKAMLFKGFGGVDAFPICLATKDPEEIIKTVKLLAPTFGGINLEDISAPRCFEIEERLKAELDIPVFHDDQHGTAVVSLAALFNALKITGKKMEELKVIVNGVGSAGVACSKIMLEAGVKNLIGFDRTGAIYKGRTEKMNFAKEWFAEHTNPEGFTGSLSEAMHGADLFLGVSAPGCITAEDVKNMAKDPIIFAMANPIPEIMPEEALPQARIMATGRSDYPNQINNVLCFPGIFKGALRCRAKSISEGMKVAAAHAIADLIPADKLCEEYIIPSVFDEGVADAVADAVEKVAREEGLARPRIDETALYKIK